MKEHLLDYLVCPSCLPREISFAVEIAAREGEDIRQAALHCPRCGGAFPISGGIAMLDPGGGKDDGKYERDDVLASYLWSHYGDLLAEEESSEAYRTWAGLVDAAPGLALDLGGAVGRFTFELGGKCDLAVGIDRSLAFIRSCYLKVSR